uniref:Uncharacterized protein n=1 Tax=Arundo donax TaxID=35708 RepID=A0A0A9AS58_ARUDO
MTRVSKPLRMLFGARRRALCHHCWNMSSSGVDANSWRPTLCRALCQP